MSIVSLQSVVILLAVLIFLTLLVLWLSVTGKSTPRRKTLAPIKQPYSQNLLPFIQYAPKESFTDSLKSTLLQEFREPKATPQAQEKKEGNYQIKWITPQEVQELTEISEANMTAFQQQPQQAKTEEPKKSTWINVSEQKKGKVSKVKFKEEELPEKDEDEEDREEAYDPDKEAEKYILNSKKKFLQDLADSSEDEEDDNSKDKSDDEDDLFF